MARETAEQVLVGYRYDLIDGFAFFVLLSPDSLSSGCFGVSCI